MNKAIEIFGNHIYKLTQTNPQRTLKELSFVFTAAGLQCKYFPSRLLLPARQYMQWAAADSAIKPLKKADSSAIVSLYLPCEILHAMGIYQLFPEALSCYLAAAGTGRFLENMAKVLELEKQLNAKYIFPKSRILRSIRRCHLCTKQ